MTRKNPGIVAIFAFLPFLCGCAEVSEVAASAGSEGILEPSAAPFTLTGDVLENTDVSAIARGDGGLGVMAADEGAVVQALSFAPSGDGAVIRANHALARPADLEIDFEAAAFSGGWYYVTGSHGVAKTTGEYQASRARLYRFRLEGAERIADLQEASLEPLLAADSVLSWFHRKPLQRRGVNIEGLAAREGRLYFGLRSPNLGGDALVLGMAADDLFADGVPEYELLRVPLGEGLGIRAMTVFRDGFLLIAGNAGSEANDAISDPLDYDAERLSGLFFWQPDRETVTPLGLFPRIGKGKEEAILVLNESPEDATDILVLYDSLAAGGATRFLVSIPDSDP